MTQPGWYPDQAGGPNLKYWDGQRWHDAPAKVPETSASVPSSPVKRPTTRNRREVIAAWALGSFVFVGGVIFHFKDQLSAQPANNQSAVGGASIPAVRATQAPELKREAPIGDVIVIDAPQFQPGGGKSEVVAGVTVSSLQPVPARPYFHVNGALYAVNVYVKVGQGSLMVNPFFFAARTENGTNLRATAAAGSQEMLPAAEVPAGQQVSGWIVFDVPPGQHIKEVIMSDPGGHQLGRWTVP